MQQKQLYNFGVYSPLKRIIVNKLIKTNLGGIFKMAKEKSEWKKIEAEIFKFEKTGDNIEGILLDVEDSSNYDTKVYKIKVVEKTKVIFGTSVLDSLLKNVSLGTNLKILFTGTKENTKQGQNDIKMFEVFVKNI